MKIRVRDNPNAEPASQTFVSSDREYDVWAIAFFEGTAYLHVTNDLRIPTWLPMEMFEITNTEIATDWICNCFPNPTKHASTMIIGPAFVARSEEAYCRMVELDPEQVQLFWERVDALAGGNDGSA